MNSPTTSSRRGHTRADIEVARDRARREHNLSVASWAFASREIWLGSRLDTPQDISTLRTVPKSSTCVTDGNFRRWIVQNKPSSCVKMLPMPEIRTMASDGALDALARLSMTAARPDSSRCRLTLRRFYRAEACRYGFDAMKQA